ncbi:MAG: HIT family protein [Stackebrandtia sp.]
MCQGNSDPDLGDTGYIDAYGYTVSRLDASILRLVADQYSRGYCILISDAHGPELHDLDSDQASRFFADLTRASKAIAHAMAADKMNLEILGNAVPHVHTHLVPRYYGDSAPGARLLRDHNAPATLGHDEYADIARRIRYALASGQK